jgi:hypothetical protein
MRRDFYIERATMGPWGWGGDEGLGSISVPRMKHKSGQGLPGCSIGHIGPIVTLPSSIPLPTVPPEHPTNTSPINTVANKMKFILTVDMVTLISQQHDTLRLGQHEALQGDARVD